MPEGDTLFQTASRLRPELVGAELRRVELRGIRGMDRLRVGDRVTSVESRGKYLEIEVERGFVLRTHLRMTGSWHLYRPGERWRRARHLARAVLETDDSVAVCFAAPVVEVGRVGDCRLDHLGPDLCRPEVDLDEIVERVELLAEPGTEIADVLLDQRVAAGIGNVYKSEALFACRVDPFTPVADIGAGDRRRLFDTAARQLRANLEPGQRTTVPGGLAVYGRTRKPCLACGTPIAARDQGPQGRRTYWCPRCQDSAAIRSSPST
jgi:endonuclease-8